MSVVQALQRGFIGVHARVYEGTRGRLGHRLAGVPCLVLYTTGRRTGRTRTSVLVYARDGDRYVLVASNGGSDRPPAWLLNVRAERDVEVLVGRSRRAGTATVVERGEPGYDDLWRLANEGNRGRYDRYQARTDRPIPLVVVTPGRPGPEAPG